MGPRMLSALTAKQRPGRPRSGSESASHGTV